ncbi:hypothetical protein ACTMU2_38770 [Cupriavidus basilensis]
MRPVDGRRVRRPGRWLQRHRHRRRLLPRLCLHRQPSRLPSPVTSWCAIWNRTDRRRQAAGAVRAGPRAAQRKSAGVRAICALPCPARPRSRAAGSSERPRRLRPGRASPQPRSAVHSSPDRGDVSPGLLAMRLGTRPPERGRGSSGGEPGLFADASLDAQTLTLATLRATLGAER